MSEILKVINLSKSYIVGYQTLGVLQEVSFSLKQGDSFAIVGPSGSGKTTLLGLCAGLDRSSAGEVWLNNILLNPLSEDQRARVRNAYIGFVFQNFQLLPTLTALENVMIPLELKGMKKAKKQALEWLDKVGLAQRSTHYPTQLSGGEQQRVALARAFANEPLLLFADEPTGNLDEENSLKVEKLLFELNQEHQTTLVIVTHNIELAHKTQRIIQLKNGKVVAEVKPFDSPNDSLSPTY